MRTRKKNSMYIALIALVLLISVGFALLSANLKINGTSRINNVSWDVHFENAQATENATVIPTVAPSAPAADKLQQISYDVTFDTPGQVYEFTVDVANGGTIDAMVDSIKTKMQIGDEEEVVVASDKSNLPRYLDYTVTYSNDTAIASNHLLAANARETIKVRLVFKLDINNSDLVNASGKSIKMNLELNYKQADTSSSNSGSSNTDPVNPGSTNTDPVNNASGDKFVVSTTEMHIGSELPEGVNGRDTENEAMADWQGIAGVTRPYFLKHTLNELSEITASYVGFVISDELANANEGLVAGTYYLKGGDSGTSFANSINTIKTAFGYDTNPNRCGGNEAEDFHCSVGSGDNYLYISASYGGFVSASLCEVNAHGVSVCRSNF